MKLRKLKIMLDIYAEIYAPKNFKKTSTSKLLSGFMPTKKEKIPTILPKVRKRLKITFENSNTTSSICFKILFIY